MPDAPVATMPPIVAFAPGSTEKNTPSGRRRVVELPAGHAGLDGDVHVVDREAQDRVHAAHVDRHAAAQRGDVALERRARAERDDRRAVLGADAHEARAPRRRRAGRRRGRAARARGTTRRCRAGGGRPRPRGRGRGRAPRRARRRAPRTSASARRRVSAGALMGRSLSSRARWSSGRYAAGGGRSVASSAGSRVTGTTRGPPGERRRSLSELFADDRLPRIGPSRAVVGGTRDGTSGRTSGRAWRDSLDRGAAMTYPRLAAGNPWRSAAWHGRMRRCAQDAATCG